MMRCGPLRRLLAWALLAFGLTCPQAGRATECLQSPPPENPDNRVGLCSPTPDEVQVEILREGVRLTWDAPPRATTAYVGPVTAMRWTGVDSADVVTGVTLLGDYLAVRDRRIQFDVENIDSLGTTSANTGLIGRDRVRIRWTSIYEASVSGAVGGIFDLRPGYAGTSLRFDVPNPNPTFPPDTTVVAGLRVRFRVGDQVTVEDGAFFDLEDFEGWHVWRWGADPTSPNYLSAGEYSKVFEVVAPAGSWPGIQPNARRIVFFDSDVFDGFLYHYAITTFDQGFRRNSGGGDLALKFDSPLEIATRNPDGTVTLGSTQIEVQYRNAPPQEFVPIAAVPNPFRESEADPSRPETQKVFFINAPAKGTLYVWTVAGDLVLQRDHEQPTVGTISWDTTNQSGKKVASGVYIYKIVDLVSGQQSYGRLAIIR